MIAKTIKTLVRDNDSMNYAIRNMVRMIHQYIKPVNRLTSFYRVYGTAELNVCLVHFKIYTKADDHIANEIYYNQQYEINEFKLIKELTRNGGFFIDIGANTGIFSIFAAKANPRLNVIAFEPHPGNFNRLITNISINKLSNIEVLPNALGSSKMDIEFVVPSNESISTTTSPNEGYTKSFHHMEYKKIVVRQLKLDDVLAKMPINSSDVVKIDVECYEWEVLRGAESTLRNNRPIIVIEILQYENLISQFPDMKDKIQHDNASRIFNFLTSLDYSCYAIGSEGVNFIGTLQNQPNRNFLFMPMRLLLDHYSYDEIGTLLLERSAL